MGLAFENERAIADMQSPRGVGLRTVTIGSQVFAYLPGRVSLSRALEEGGFAADVTTVFLCKRSLFGGNIPRAKTILTDNKDGRRYRIATVNDSADGSYISFECVDANKDA